MTLRIAPLSLAEMLGAIESMWSPQSAPVREAFGKSADVVVTCQTGGVWTIV